MRSTRSARFGETFFVLIFTICRVYASKWLFRYFYEYFWDFLVNVGTRGLRISPQHGLEDVAVVLVIYANLPNLPCKCQKKLALAIDLGKELSMSQGVAPQTRPQGNVETTRPPYLRCGWMFALSMQGWGSRTTVWGQTLWRDQGTWLNMWLVNFSETGAMLGGF